MVISIDKKDIVKEALHQLFGQNVNFDIDLDAIANNVHMNINGRGHWTNSLVDTIQKYRENASKELIDKLRNSKLDV